MESFQVKQEILEHSWSERRKNPQPEASNSKEVPVIDLSSSSGSDSDDHDDSSSSSSSEEGDVNGKRSRDSGRGEGSVSKKRKKLDELVVVLPVGFLEPLHPKEAVSRGSLASPPADAVVPRSQVTPNGNVNRSELAVVGNCKQFWKAGNYDGAQSLDWDPTADGMDHVRVHPKFLHSNATSHKWVLGAFAELLDNAMDEVCNGATHVNIDVLENKKDRSRMLLIEDNGGGMHPDKMRQCMSLGYSLKSKVANTIGQYGNGFKTSTMRLGADVIVFSRCSGNHEKRPTQSIGLLSYTFLRSTGKEDIVVPMLDYERQGEGWNKILRSSASDWSRNVEAIVQWSPFSCEADLLQQFNHMKDQGTLIIIYNLWEDDQGLLELDFNTDLHDIQIRGVNRDEKKIEMAKQFPNSRHFLTYRHSLRSYASILYLRIPPGFRIILRGKDVEHHNVVNDMMMTQEVTYRPQTGDAGIPKDSNMVADVTIGFVKDAKAHIDVQGFNVYHKNRLIKPFWRVWNAAGSDGRGVIGVLEANFVEPAHDKQGFERTIVLSRLETRLVQMQKSYWSTNCDKIGYAPRRNRKSIGDKESSPDYLAPASPQSRRYSTLSNGKAPVSASDKVRSFSNQKQSGKVIEKHHKTLEKSHGNGHLYSKAENKRHASRKWPSSLEHLSPFPQEVSDDNGQTGIHDRQANGTREGNDVSGNERHPSYSDSQTLDQLKEENRRLRERLKKKEKVILGDLLNDLQYQRDRCKSLEAQLQEATKKIEDLNEEQESLLDIFSEERERRNIEEENLRKKLKDASNTIQELLNKVRMLEKMKTPNGK